MTLTEEKDIRDVVKRLEMLDEHDREVVSITVNMLLAIQTVDASKEWKNERSEEKGSSSECTDDSHEKL